LSFLAGALWFQILLKLLRGKKMKLNDASTESSALKNKFLRLISRVLRVFYRMSESAKQQGKIEAYDPFVSWSQDEYRKSTEHFKQFFSTAVHLDSAALRDHALNRALETDVKGVFIELGVHAGRSINQYAKLLKPHAECIHGFDSFEGLKEDWGGTTLLRGHFDLAGKLPKVYENVYLYKGWIQDSLPEFIKTKNLDAIKFLSLDLDTYESTRDALEILKPYIVKNTIIMFDEIYNIPGWEDGEYKALGEFFSPDEYQFKSFARDGCCAAIQIL
jgi:hypothetical protein